MPSQHTFHTLRFGANFFFYYALIGITAPYLALYLAEQGFTAMQIGLLVGTTSLTRIAAPTLWGWLADHSGLHVQVLRACTAAGLLSLLGLYGGVLSGVPALRSFAWFFAFLFAYNFFMAAHTPISETLMVSSLQGNMRRYGRLRLWGSIGFVVAVMAGGAALEKNGVQVFWPLILSALVLTWFSDWALPKTTRACLDTPISSLSPAMGKFLKQRHVQYFFASCAMMIFAHGAIYGFLSLHLAHQGYSKENIGWFWSLGVVTEVVFFYFQGSLFKRVSARAVLLACFVLAALRFALIAQWANVLMALLIAQMLHAASFAAHHSATVMYLQKWFPPQWAARAQALYVSLGYGVGGSLGALAAGAVWQNVGETAVFWGACVAALVGGALAWRSVCESGE